MRSSYNEDHEIVKKIEKRIKSYYEINLLKYI